MRSRSTIELAKFVAEGRANISFTFAKSSWPVGSVDYCCRVVKSELTVDLKNNRIIGYGLWRGIRRMWLHVYLPASASGIIYMGVSEIMRHSNFEYLMAIQSITGRESPGNLEHF